MEESKDGKSFVGRIDSISVVIDGISVVIDGREFRLGERASDPDARAASSAAIEACLMRQFLAEFSWAVGPNAPAGKVEATFERWLASLSACAIASMIATLGNASQEQRGGVA
jgi:hypothetical protein